MKKKIVVGITGASGAPYAKRLLSWLDERVRTRDDVEVGVCLSATAPEVWKLECGGELRGALPFPSWGMRDYGAPFASGSAGWHAMVVVPCSMGTAALGPPTGSATRSSTCAPPTSMLKERRTLIVVPRETPLSAIHLDNQATLARAAALVLPAMPTFYGKPTTHEQAIDTVVARIVDHLGLDHDLVRRWGEKTGASSEAEESR